MMSAQILRQRLEIRRAALATPAAVDEWNQPTYAADTTVATVDGQIQPLSDREVATLVDAGAQIGDYKAFMFPSDVRTGDRIRVASTTVDYEVRSVVDAAGIGHHLELLLRRVVD